MRFASFILLTSLVTIAEADSDRCFRISVIDSVTERGVPLVELRTVNGIRLFTDSAGVVAFHEPGMMDQDVYFHVRSHGYEYPKDGFGYRGTRLKTETGGKAVVRLKRNNIAERLYRVTGQGIYRDSVLLGDPVPIDQPVFNGRVLGSDSVVNALHKGRIHWFWGDTNRPDYPLGNFHVPGAMSQLPNNGGLDPSRGVNLRYLVDESGFAKPTCKMAGDGPTWISGLVSLPDKTGRDRLLAMYVKVQGMMTVYRRGLAEFNETTEVFEHLIDIPLDAPLYPFGHPFRYSDEGIDYVYFADPIATVRVPANVESLLDLSQYEAWTCLPAGIDAADGQPQRSASGDLQFRWRKNTPPISDAIERQLLQAGKITDEERLFRFRDRQTGKGVIAHRGSVYWNAFKDSWLMVFTELGGRSQLGEVWLAKADSPSGPWSEAIRVLTHDQYSFYNPKQHPLFSQQDGRYLYFEGTYTKTFSGNSDPTPQYDYNQIMYRIDLADPEIGFQ